MSNVEPRATFGRMQSYDARKTVTGTARTRYVGFNGTGRDTYIAINSGGVVAATPKYVSAYHESFRMNAQLERRKSYKQDSHDWNHNWVVKNQRKLINEAAKAQAEHIMRLS